MLRCQHFNSESKSVYESRQVVPVTVAVLITREKIRHRRVLFYTVIEGYYNNLFTCQLRTTGIQSERVL